MTSVEPRLQSPWDWRAAIQFMCGGAGTGLLFFSALAAWNDPAWLWRTGLAAGGLVCLGLVSVWFKLGRRWRALFVIYNPRTSWMTREALLAAPLLGLALGAILLRSPALASLAAAVGLCFLYAQARILQEARGIPAWRGRLALLLVVTTGLAEGASLLAAASAIFGSPGAWLPGALGAVLIVRLVVWWLYRRRLSAPGVAPALTVQELDGLHAGLCLWGHGLPLAALLLAWAAPWMGASAVLVAGLAGWLSGWYLKFALVTRLAHTQGFALARTPARTPGYAGPGVKPGWTESAAPGGRPAQES